MLGGSIMPGYTVPDSKNKDDYVKFIASLPDSDGPETFGINLTLNPNTKP